MEHLAIAEIDLKALAHNVTQLRNISTSPHLMAVVKADGYGHGAVPAAQTALRHGADQLAVARLGEALALRQAGIDAPLLLFGHNAPETVETLIDYHITAAVNDPLTAKKLSDVAMRLGKKLRVHLKVDTGMGRLGIVAVPPQRTADRALNRFLERIAGEVLNVARLPGLHIEGLFTHFANADRRNKDHAEQQFALFMSLLEMLKRHAFEVEVRHAANSAATLEMPQTHLDMVRPGIALYGLWPSEETDRRRVDLQPVLTLRSRVIGLKTVAAGFAVSYGSTYRTSGPTVIATVALGYADGLNRLLSSRGSLLIGGERCPIIGRVCMDLVMADVTHVKHVAIEDPAIAIGRQGKQQITAEEMASLVGTINYEVATSIPSRVQRLYRE